jgi:myo-inositol 2-dehydrogenase/D-chiro-inositol 1-dehydrogenase
MRVGWVIGTGAIGAWHARILAESGVGLAAVCDTDPDRARPPPSARQSSTDPDAFFASGLDAVIVATPEALHEAHVIAAAARVSPSWSKSPSPRTWPRCAAWPRPSPGPVSSPWPPMWNGSRPDQRG